MVNVIIDQTTTVSLNEVRAGRYEFHNDFVGKIGKYYKLEFTTSDGKSFESRTEHMIETPEIENIQGQWKYLGTRQII